MLTDKYGKNAACLQQKKLFLFDMDGTIYEEDRLFDGTLSLLEAVRRQGGRSVFITNNSSRSVEDYVKKVQHMGIEVSTEDFFTSVQATVLLLKKEYPDVLVYAQGTVSMLQELRASGIRVTEQIEDGIGVVLVGFDTELTFEKLRRTCELLTERDLPFYACNPDLVCPCSFGFVPDCGSMCVGIYNATGKKPIYIGKPEKTMIEVVRQKFGCTKDETVVIGDRLYTDIRSGNNAGVTTVCVLSGEATEADIAAGEDRPTFIFDSVKDILL